MDRDEQLAVDARVELETRTQRWDHEGPLSALGQSENPLEDIFYEFGRQLGADAALVSRLADEVERLTEEVNVLRARLE